MNKKRLSVVMAGAMLASSVAPVLAAEEVAKVEMEKGALINELTAKVWAAPVFSKDSRVGEVNSTTLVGKSVYAIQIDKEPIVLLEKANKGLYTESDLQAEIKGKVEGLKVGQEVKLIDLGYREVEEDGNKLILSTNPTTKYTKAELTEDGAGSVNKELSELLKDSAPNKSTYELIIKSHGYNEKDGVYEINLTEEAAEGYGKDKIVLKADETERLDFGMYYDKTAKKLKEVNSTNLNDNNAVKNNFVRFAQALPQNDDIANKNEAIYTIVSGRDTFKLADLYDGLYLTEQGQNILDSAKEALLKAANATGGTPAQRKRNAIVINDLNKSSDKRADDVDKVLGADDSIKTLTPNKGNYSIEIVIGTDKYNVTGTNESQLRRFARWIDSANAQVDVIAGEDRYATAVKLAKEVALTSEKNAGSKDIVLVNGYSLVDGLAAAPLAGHLKQENGGTEAPILLTEKNSLPRATKRYLRELIDMKENKGITVHIVGGEGVVSDSVKKELRDLGLKVERLAGEDREGTSMAVANEIGFDNGAFVVGATGEADAMSISGIAASKIAPVIVSGFEGLSEDTIDALDGSKVNVIGGNAQISEADEEEVAAVAESVKRISGEDRKETNAKVIEAFYKKSFAGTRSVIVAKDDVLVDALTAANLSAKDHAPIVLGRNSLSASQKSAIAYNAGSVKKIYQMSREVSREVTKAVAQALKLS